VAQIHIAWRPRIPPNIHIVLTIKVLSSERTISGIFVTMGMASERVRIKKEKNIIQKFKT
jgi:hypothetical protein